MGCRGSRGRSSNAVTFEVIVSILDRWSIKGTVWDEEFQLERKQTSQSTRGLPRKLVLYLMHRLGIWQRDVTNGKAGLIRSE